MKKVILNQISKAVAGGSNYFYLPLHFVDDGKDSHYETTADISKLFELDSNKVPVVKEVCVYDKNHTTNVYLSYSGWYSNEHCYISSNGKNTHALSLYGNYVVYDQSYVVKLSTDEDDNSSPNDGGK